LDNLTLHFVCNALCLGLRWVLFLFCLYFVMVVEFVKLIRMMPHTRMEKTQPPPTMDGIVLVMVDGLVNQCHLC
jgi:hypothetical protein